MYLSFLNITITDCQHTVPVVLVLVAYVLILMPSSMYTDMMSIVVAACVCTIYMEERQL
jgi:hypothetical protein